MAIESRRFGNKAIEELLLSLVLSYTIQKGVRGDIRGRLRQESICIFGEIEAQNLPHSWPRICNNGKLSCAIRVCHVRQSVGSLGYHCCWARLCARVPV